MKSKSKAKITVMGALVMALLNPLTASAQQAAANEPTVAGAKSFERFSGFARGVYFPWERIGWVAKNAGLDTWTYCDRLLGELKNRYHTDVIWVIHTGDEDSKRLGALAVKHNITAIFESYHAVGRNELRTPESVRGIAADTFKGLGSMPGVAGYVLKDEPLLGDIESMENIRHELALIDPHKPSFAVTMPRETETLARNTKIPFLVPDCYPFFGDDSPNGPSNPEQSRAYYRLVSQRTADLANETGKTPWIMPMIFSDLWGNWFYDKAMNTVVEPNTYVHWRMPTVGETRWQIWQAVAAGVKGTVFYVLFPEANDRRSAQDPADLNGFRSQKPDPTWPHTTRITPTGWGTGLLYNDGSATPQMEAMAAAFGKIEPHSALLGRLQPTLPLAYAAAPLRASTFRDPQTDRTYVALVNDNTNTATTGTVWLLPKVTGARDLMAGSSIVTTPAQAGVDAATLFGQVSLPITLGPGEGTLLALEGDAGATRTFREDFSIAQSAATQQNIQKIAVPREWGLGYQIFAKTGARPTAKTNADYGQPVVAPAGGQSAPATDKAAAETVTQGQLDYKFKDVAGYRDGVAGRLYLLYSGNGVAGKPSVQLSVSADEKTFRPIAVDRFDIPVEIPADARFLRFTLLNDDAALLGWQLIAVP